MQLYNFLDIFSNLAIRSAFFAWLIAQLLKVPIYFWVTGKLDWSRACGSGGMPSSHSAAVLAATVSIGMTDGFAGTSFAVAAVLSSIVMYDAAGVRRAAGNHARILNEISEVLFEHKPVTDKKLKEWLGHTPFEVLVGAILGIMISVIVTLISRNAQV